MSAPVVTTGTDVASDASLAPARRGSPGHRRSVAGGRLSPVTGPRPSTRLAGLRTEAPGADVPAIDAPGAGGEQGAAEPLVMTISIGVGSPAHRDRVLAALRQLVTAAGPDASVSVPDVVLPPRPRTPLPSVVAAAASVGLIADPAGDAPAAPMSPVRLDPGPRTALRDGWPLELSRLEYDLLLFLARHPRQVFGRAQLLAQVWGHTHTGARTVDVHVSRLRTKLGAESELITTVYGLGYRLADDAAIEVVER